MKTLVVYYSYSGKTEIVAQTIAAETGADIRKIEEVRSRGNIASLYISGGYEASRDKCSEIKPCDLNLDGYDTIFIGTPNWANKPAPAINTFITRCDFTDKTVIPFCTMGGRPGYESLFTNFNGKIAAKSGRVVGNFAVRTFRKKDSDIAEATKTELASLPFGIHKEENIKELSPV